MRQRLEQLRAARKEASDKQPPRVKRGQDNNKENTGADSPSRKSKHDRVAQRIEKLRRQRLKAEYDEEEEEEEENEIRNKKELTQAQKRQKRFTKLQLLVLKARKAAADPTSTLEKLNSIDQEVLNALGDVDKKRAETEQEILRLRTALMDKRKIHEENLVDLKDIRSVYLELHHKNVQRKVTEQWDKRTKGKKQSRHHVYFLTVKYLEMEIKKVEMDIKALNLRAKTGQL